MSSTFPPGDIKHILLRNRKSFDQSGRKREKIVRVEEVGSGISERRGNPLEKLGFPSAPRAEPGAPVGAIEGSGQLLLQGAQQRVLGLVSAVPGGLASDLPGSSWAWARHSEGTDSLPLSSSKRASAQARGVAFA